MHFSWQPLFFASVLIFFIHNAYADQIQTDNTNNVEIQNIQVQPPTIKVGNTFTVNATLVNNSPNLILLQHGVCDGPFSVVFDNHVTVNQNQIICPMIAMLQKIEPGGKITITSPGSALAYRATAAGTANATVTIPYTMRNQTDPNQPETEKTISKSFLFTISDNITGTATDQKSSAKESIRIIPEYPITGGFGNNGTVQVFFTIEILFDNFKRTDSPLIVKIFNPKGELYKEDNIPSSNIQSDGFYKYKIYIVGNEGSDLGKYQVVVTYDNATALTSAYLSNTFP